MASPYKNVSVMFYIGLYAFWYAVVFGALVIVTSFFNVMTGWLATPLITSAYIATKFIKAVDRPMTTTEKIQLISGTALCTLVINIIYNPRLLKFLLCGGDAPLGPIVGQVFILLSISLVFGVLSTEIYNSSKK